MISEQALELPQRRIVYVEFIRYFGVSLGALAVDFALLITLSQFVHYLVAATIAFCSGAAVNYLLSIWLVFDQRRLESSPRKEALIFFAIGVAGLGLNDLAIFVSVSALGLSLVIGKLLAAGVSFVFNFAARKVCLF